MSLGCFERHREPRTSMLIAFVSTIERKWNQSRCPSAGEWVIKIWIIHTLEFNSAVRENEICRKMAVYGKHNSKQGHSNTEKKMPHLLL